MKESSINKEREILLAAEEEFMNKGYDGTKTTTIAKKANVTHAMLHYYFRTKENLFNKILDAKIELITDAIINPFLESKEPIVEKILSSIRAHFDFLAANPNLPRFVVNEIVSNEERSRVISKKIERFHDSFGHVIQHELDEKAKAGILHPIKITDLLIDVLSLNVFSFLLLPIMNEVINKNYSSLQEFFNQRKDENCEIIKKRLLINQ